MTKEEIVKYAKADLTPEIRLSSAEMTLFYTLRDVYRKFKSGKIGVTDGEAKKNQAMKQYELDAGEIAQAKEILRHNAAMWQEIEEAGNRYRLERTLENADAFVEAVYGVGIKNNFLKGGKNNEAENNPPG